MTEKKVLLFIVEGISDETALAPALEKIISARRIKFKVMRSDITSDYASNVSNIEKRIKEQCVKKFLFENTQFTHNDICEIVHIVDTDGAFIPNNDVFTEDIEDPVYLDKRINCKNRDLFIKTKENKVKNLLHLMKIKEIAIPFGKKVPYSVYFMSCNLDHVLHDKRNSTDTEKKENSLDFAEQYDEPESFKTFFEDKLIKIDGTYETTWNYIQQNYNSLARGSNFWLYISKYI